MSTSRASSLMTTAGRTGRALAPPCPRCEWRQRRRATCDHEHAPMGMRWSDEHGWDDGTFRGATRHASTCLMGCTVGVGRRPVNMRTVNTRLRIEQFAVLVSQMFPIHNTVETTRVQLKYRATDLVHLTRSRDVGGALLQDIAAPAGAPEPARRSGDRPVHVPARSAPGGLSHVLGATIPPPRHARTPSPFERHVRSTFNLSTCLCASLCMCNTGLLHGRIEWACLDWR